MTLIPYLLLIIHILLIFHSILLLFFIPSIFFYFYLEEGNAIQQIIAKYGLTQKQIAEKFGKSETCVSNRLTIELRLIKEVQYAISAERITLLQAEIISQLSPKEGKLTPYFQTLQRKRGKPKEGSQNNPYT